MDTSESDPRSDPDPVEGPDLGQIHSASGIVCTFQLTIILTCLLQSEFTFTTTYSEDSCTFGNYVSNYTLTVYDIYELTPTSLYAQLCAE